MVNDARRNIECAIREASFTLNSNISQKFEYGMADCQSIPYEDNTYDCIIANHVMFYCDNIDKAFGEIQRVLKPGGIFICATYGSHHMQEISKLVKEFDKRIVLACMGMSKRKVGALIVIERTAPLDDVAATGDIIDANINQRLIENIFFKNSPLHDGAMIISKKRIKAAGCILPVSHNLDIPKELGLRHRAALGISQQCDCIAVIVSEETGGISVAMNGAFQLRLSAEKLESILTDALEEQPSARG